jgi:hypothetical protein
MSFRRLVCVAIALTALLAWSAGSVSTAAAGSDADAPTAAKKKCKGKKKWSPKAKKCVKKKKATQPTGPQIPAGDYYCSYYTSFGFTGAGSVQILAGNRYTVNDGTAGTYKYFPATGVMQFPTGDYRSFYAVYDADAKAFEVYANEAMGGVEIGDYAWTCSA